MSGAGESSSWGSLRIQFPNKQDQEPQPLTSVVAFFCFNFTSVHSHEKAVGQTPTQGPPHSNTILQGLMLKAQGLLWGWQPLGTALPRWKKHSQPC